MKTKTTYHIQVGTGYNTIIEADAQLKILKTNFKHLNLRFEIIYRTSNFQYKSWVPFWLVKFIYRNLYKEM
jgi:hypothetical protein